MTEIHDRPERETQSFTLRLRRFNPESGEASYWDEHTVELEPHRSVLEGILQARDRTSTARSESAAPVARRSAARAASASTANPRWPATPISTPPGQLDATA